MVKTSPSSTRDVGLILGGEVKIPLASLSKNPQKKVKQKQYCNKFIKGFNSYPH